MITIQEIAADIARELRWDRTRWAKGAYAYDSTGLPVVEDDPRATRWCLLGHIRKRDRYVNAITRARFRSYTGTDLGLPQWNDAPERTVEDVIALCDKVAAS